MIDAVVAVFFVQVNDGFSVRGGREPVAARAQTIAQFRKGVDLTIQDNADISIFREYRLTAGSQVDDLQPADGNSHVAVKVVALLIWAAMKQLGVHPLENARVDYGLRVAFNYSADAAHRLTPK